MNLKIILKWLIPIGALGFLCIGALALTGGLTWLNSRASATNGEPAAFSLGDLFKASNESSDNAPVPNPNQPLGSSHQVFVPLLSKPLVANPTSATLQSLHGLVQLQQADGSWQTVETITLEVGQTIRTWAYSSAVLHFFDGSYVLLAADTRLTLEAVNAPTDGPRTITLFQPYGHTTHQVASIKAYGIAYDVRTPSATGTAKGTIFEVAVQEDKTSRFDVLEGSVNVTGQQAAVALTAGQTSSVADGENPSAPVFWISGEGEVTQTGDIWIIGGLEFQTHPDTLLIGDPQVGDTVSVRGRLLPDGTRLADRISLLAPSQLERFRLTGLVESMGAESWVVSGQTIYINDTTNIDDTIVVGSRVLVTGLIRTGGQLFAESITLLEEDTTRFEFTGLLESIEGNLWTIAGVPITVDENTEITGDPVVGDLVHVEGRILPDGTWLAREIRKVDSPNRFEIIGTVESIAPWLVSGIGFEVDEFTLIEPGIVVGSLVRVTGRIMEDGTWLARSIELLDETNTLVFIGIVDSIDPWVVNGLPLTTDENTVFIGDIVISSLVRVTVFVQPDGSWLVLQMELIEVGPVVGCVEFVDWVVGLTSEDITLATGVVIPRAIAEVEGDLQIGSQVVVKLCFGPDNVMVYAWIIVIDDPVEPTPTPGPTGTPPPGGNVTLCHIPPGNPDNAHTITVGEPAVDAHLAHGDYLGPCTGGEGGDRDNKNNNGKKDD